MKKFLLFLLIAIIIISIIVFFTTQNKTNDNKSQDNVSQTEIIDKNNNKTDDSKLTKSIDFFGFIIPYSNEYVQEDIDFGYAIRNNEFVITIMTPAKGIYDNKITTAVNNLPQELESFVLDAFGRELRAYFAYGQTSQEITNQTVKTYNGIEMVITEGSLYNEKKDKTMNCSAAYMYGGTNGDFPVCIVGFSKNSNENINSVVNTIIKNIKKK